MAIQDVEKVSPAERVEDISSQKSDEVVVSQNATVSNDDHILTPKLCWVIFILSSTFGLSFWPVPTTAALGGALATQFDAPLSYVWYVPAYTTGCSLGFLIAGANSDIFGRRIFLLFGHVMCCVGFLVTATAKSTQQFTAGLAIGGFGGGFAQMAMCALPELIPNKYRHIGICLSDGFVFIIVIIGPVVGRYAIDAGANGWRLIYYIGFAAQFISGVSLYLFYYPPKHPKGVAWRDGLRGLDYVGMILIIPGVCLVLVGIINTTYLPSKDKTVLVPLVVGFVLVTAFGFWETLSNTKYKLCPPHLFRSHNGREFTAPFVLAFIVTMTYYGTQIVTGTAINALWLTPTSTRSEALILTLPANIGLVFGACLLMGFGNLLGHWRFWLIVTFTLMVVFSGLGALITPFNKGMMLAFIFLLQTFFGWAQYISIAFTQLGVPQLDLGMSGGLAGVARFAGGSLATAIYTTVLTNSQTSRAASTIPKAAIEAGLSSSAAAEVLPAFAKGAAALQEIPGMTTEILAKLGLEYAWSYCYGLKMVSLASLGFGGLGIVMCCLCENIDDKMNDKTNVFLENDLHADKNEYH